MESEVRELQEPQPPVSERSRTPFELGLYSPPTTDTLTIIEAIEAEGDTDAERAVGVLQFLDGERLSRDGGYPAAISTQIRGYTLVADLDHDEAPQLTIHRNQELAAQYRRTRTLLKLWRAEYEADPEKCDRPSLGLAWWEAEK